MHKNADRMRLVRSPDFPKRLYKFMRAEHATLLCERSKVRYGTIYDFRRAENHGHGVLDTEEGLIHYNEHVTRATGDQLSEPLQGFFGSGNPTLVNCNFKDVICTEPDQWVYCFSLSPSWDVEIDPAYTACVEIFNPEGFIMKLTEHIARIGNIERFFHHAPVEYKGREFTATNIDGKLSAELPKRLGVIKPERYADQREYRVLYVPVNQYTVTIEPFCAQVPGISLYCRRYSLRP